MAANRSGALLTEGPLLRATLVFGWPLVAGMAFHSLFNLVDLYIVGQLPDASVAHRGGVDPVARQLDPDDHLQRDRQRGDRAGRAAHGHGQPPRGNYEAGQGLVLAVLLGVALGVPPYLLARPICAALGAAGGRARPGDRPTSRS